MVAVFGISTVITGPLSQIVGTVEQISRGDLSRRAPVSSRDEVGHPASSFNLMVDRLQSVYSELEYINQNLEKRVHERTTDLQKEIDDHKRTEELKARLYQELLNAYEHLQQTQDKLIEGEKLRVLGEMVAMIAHEVRNPLGAIENCLAVLRRHPQLEHRYTEMVELTQGEVSRLNKMVKDLLIFGKPGIPEFVQVDLAALAEEVVRVVKQDAEFLRVWNFLAPTLWTCPPSGAIPPRCGNWY